MQYLLPKCVDQILRVSKVDFLERRLGEVPRIVLLGAPVNKGGKRS